MSRGLIQPIYLKHSLFKAITHLTHTYIDISLFGFIDSFNDRLLTFRIFDQQVAGLVDTLLRRADR